MQTSQALIMRGKQGQGGTEKKELEIESIVDEVQKRRECVLSQGNSQFYTASRSFVVGSRQP